MCVLLAESEHTRLDLLLVALGYLLPQLLLLLFSFITHLLEFLLELLTNPIFLLPLLLGTEFRLTLFVGFIVLFVC